jgi:cleavage and polyadenylation specificity factor subunit 3
MMSPFPLSSICQPTDDCSCVVQTANPFNLQHVTHLKSASQLDDVGPCVVLATPSMLQSGLSRDLFEAWCEDPRNGIIIADFAVQGTLAREILGGPDTVLARSGQKVWAPPLSLPAPPTLCLALQFS